MKRDAQDLQEWFSRLAEGRGIDWSAFSGANVFVTGATGLIGFNVVAALLVNAECCDVPPTVYALVRDPGKARERFSQLPQERLNLVVGDVSRPIRCETKPDYIVHAAARTDSKGMVEEPLSIINTTIDGVRNVLDFARESSARNTVFVSSMEVYGAHRDEGAISEHDYGLVDQLQVRSSYPESKRMAENICCSYASQYGAPVCIARLAQTLGPDSPEGDRRLVAYLAQCAREGRDIELQTTGESTRMYVSAADAAAAILVLLTKGRPGEAYNVANPSTYCSIKQMADYVSQDLAKESIAVRVGLGDVKRFPPSHHLRLDTHGLTSLGWTPADSLEDMFRSLIEL